MEADYLVCLSNMPMFRPVFKQMAVGSTQIHIRGPIYAAIEVPLPPLIEQSKFAARMDVVARLKLVHNAALAHLDDLFASLQHRAFRGEL